MILIKRLPILPIITLLCAVVLCGCKIQYSGEEFSLKILPGGEGELTVVYKNFGSEETQSIDRQKDLDLLRSAARDKKTLDDARGQGVEILNRRLDFVDYTVNGFMKAKANSYKDLFKVFTQYKLEIKDRIYITPQNGLVKRAKLSDGGEIVIRGDKYAFAWPLSATDLSFEASYGTKGASFSYDFNKRSGRN